jgi:uncharacterized protein with ParB-like and HNH nuclease domain
MPNQSEHFESNAESINSIFDLARRTPFKIPRFQRGFSWNKENIDEFWDDLKSVDMRFFGTMLFNVNTNHDGTIDIVDGQQRITTITIFASLVRNLINEHAVNFETAEKQALKRYASEVERTYIKERRTNTATGAQEEILYIRHNKPEIESFFRTKIQTFSRNHEILTDTSKKDSEKGRIKTCYKELKKKIETDAIFQSALQSGGQSTLSYFGNFFERLDNFKTVEIEIRDDSLAYEYFDAVNARGVQLSIADLLKNLILKNVSQEDMPSAQSEWDTMIQNVNNITLSGCGVDQFFRYYWAAKHEYISGKGLYRAIKKHTNRPDQDWIFFLAEIITFGDIYYKICMGSNNDFRGKISDRRNRRKFYNSLQGLRAMKGARTWIVLMMNFLDENEKYEQKGVKIHKVITIIEKFVFNYFTVLSLPGNWFFQIMHSYCKEFNVLIIDNEPGHQFIRLRNELFSELKDKLNPVREDYVQKAIERLKYDSSPLIRYVFSEIEKNCVNGPNTGWNEEEVSVEHIIPQKPAEHWNFRQDEIKTSNLNMIGNLGLIEENLNEQAGNLNFISKKPIYGLSNFKLINGSQNNDDLFLSDEWEDFKLKGRTNVKNLVELIEKRSKHIVDKYIYVHFYEEWINSF